MRDEMASEASADDMARKSGVVSVDLTGARVLVTGGSRGIAAALVRAFSHAGARVVFSFATAADQAVGRPDAAAELVAELSAAGREAHALPGDLTSAGEGSAVVRQAMSLMGGIDILILSASIQVHKAFVDQSAVDVARQLQINLVANIELMQAAIPAMRAQGWGRIITIGSVQEIVPSAEMPIYALCKAGLENLVRNLSVENAPYGINVNNIAPGLIETDRNAFRRQDMTQWEANTKKANPMRRAGQPSDIVGAALYLASRSADFVTGATIHVTGGAHVARFVGDGPPTPRTPPSSS